MAQDDPNAITYFAMTNARGKDTPFGIKRRDRARHMYVIGKTGMGKSTMLENMAIQDIRNGEGMAFIDPHGSTADRIMEYIPEHRIKDVLYFAPFDMEHPVAFNVMEDVGYDKRHLVVSGLLSAFKKIWVDAWSARMEYILSNVLLALLEYDGATLLDVNRMLVNKVFRKKVVDNVKDPMVKSFWVDEFANYTDRYTQDATPAIQNKVGQFTSNPLIRNIVGQPKSSFDIRKMMDEKKILIINLSKGRVGEVNTNLLGSMLVTKIYLAAMSRADVPAAALEKLPQFYLYVDEFQNFANESFADILSEARKYKLNLIIAHQYVEQMVEEVRNAVFGNVGTTIAFRVGPFDAEVLETIFQPRFMQTDLINLGFAQIYLTLMIDGVGSPPFSATTMPPFDPPPQKFVDQAIDSSRKQFSKSRIEVEEALKKWQEVEAPEPIKKSTEPKRDFSARPQGSYASAPKPVYVPPTPRPVIAIDGQKVPPEKVLETPKPASIAGSVSDHPHEQASARPATTVAVSSPRPFTGLVPPILSAISSASPASSRSAMLHRPHTSQPVPGRAFPGPARPLSYAAPFQRAQAAPPLGGVSSLREALAMVSTNKSVEKSDIEENNMPSKQSHLASLKETLGVVVQKGVDDSVQSSKKPAELPEAELRSMLAVDDGISDTPRTDT